MKTDSYAIARAYFEAVTAGELDSLLTADMKAWTTTTGTVSKAQYQHMIRLLGAMCENPPRFTINSLTADEDRVVAEAESQATLINGEEYRNTYIFVFRVQDGLIASVAEHYNALLTQKMLMPLMEKAAQKVASRK